MKRVWSKMTKGKKIAGLVILCLAVIGGYFGYHRLTVKADQTVNRGVVNYLSEVSKDTSKELGTAENPFLLLEIVPSYDQASIGFLAEGCEPIEFKVTGNGSGEDRAQYAARYNNVGYRSSIVFEEEYLAAPDEFIGDWQKKTATSGSAVTYGYYEKTSDGSGLFNYVSNKQDGDKIVPVFEYVGEGKGNFTWVTCTEDQVFGPNGSMALWEQQEKLENKYKYAASLDQTVSFSQGDRFYTTRESRAGEVYYDCGQAGYGHGVHMNSLLRTTLLCRTPKQIENYHVIIKTVELEELSKSVADAESNNTADWIDYADFIYISTNASTMANNWNAYGSQTRLIDMSPNYGSSTSFATCGQDLTWEAAKKLFFKVNAVDKYDGSGRFGFAPAIIDFNAAGQCWNMGTSSSTSVHYLDYPTMTSTSYLYNSGTCYSSNFFKFMVMESCMSQEVFYDLFFKRTGDNGKTCIQEQNDGNGTIGLCSAQEEVIAQKSWNMGTFLPAELKRLENKYKSDSISAEEKAELLKEINALRKKYGIRDNMQYGFSTQVDENLNAKIVSDNPQVGLNGSSFMFNADNLIAQLSNAITINSENEAMNDAVKWFKDEYGEEYSELTLSQIMHYLLNYKKKGSNTDDERDRDKLDIRILEVEPCNEFIWDENSTRVGTYFPESRYNVTVDCMTTQEFNGKNMNLRKDYDVVYVGMTTGKLNTDADTTKFFEKAASQIKYPVVYNDGTLSPTQALTSKWDYGLDGKVYLHVGDLVQAASSKQLRYSGNDISNLKREALQEYAKDGGFLILDDVLASAKTNQKYKVMVDTSSEISKMAQQVYTSWGLSNVKKYSDVTGSYQELNDLLVNSKSIFTSQMKIDTSTPTVYKSSDASSKLQFDSIADAVLKFKFSINETNFDKILGISVDDELSATKYAIRIYLDLNYDGLIADDGENSELVYDSMSDATDYLKYVTDEAGVVKKSYGVGEYTFPFYFGQYVYARRNLGERQNGALTWRLEVYNVSDKYSNLMTSRQETSYYEDKSITTKNQIKFYQVMEDTSAAGNLETANRSNTAFSQMTVPGSIGSYEIASDSITGSLAEFVAHYKTADAAFSSQSEVTDRSDFILNYKYSTTTSDGGAAELAFSDYTQYIISCGTAVQKDADAMECIQFLSDNGYKILFTKDAVSQEGSSDAATQDLKDLLNQSRFTDSDVSLKDKATYALGTSAATNKTYASSYEMEYTYALVNRLGDETATENGMLCFNNSLWEKSNIKYGMSKDKSTTTTLTRINDGTITRFPYNIGKTISINATSSQDYQLNMRNSRLNVWYCLGGDEDTLYGISPNDATNNYYLYSVDNIVYTSADLTKILNTESDELKLFINTLVFDTGFKIPHVKVNAVKSLTTSDRDATISDSSGYSNQTQDEIWSFDAMMPKLDPQYIDYIPNATPMAAATSSASDNFTGLDPAETMDPDPTETPIVIATPTPAPYPETIVYEYGAVVNQYGEGVIYGSGNMWNSGSYSNLSGSTKEQVDKLRSMSDGAVIEVTYYCSELYSWGPEYNNGDLSIIVGDESAPSKYTYTQKQYTEANTDKWTEEHKMVVSLNTSGLSASNLMHIIVRPSGGNTVVNAIKVYYNQAAYDAENAPIPVETGTPGSSTKTSYDFDTKVKDYKDAYPTAAPGESAINDDTDIRNNEKDALEASNPGTTVTAEDIEKMFFKRIDSGFTADSGVKSRIDKMHYSHRVFFTPTDSSNPGGKMSYLRISFTKKGTSPEKDTDYERVKYIYTYYHDKGTNKTFIRQIKASQEGTFTIHKRNYVVEGTEYFMFYNEYYRLSDYTYIRFDLANAKQKTGYTYVCPGDKASVDTTYLFSLD